MIQSQLLPRLLILWLTISLIFPLFHLTSKLRLQKQLIHLTLHFPGDHETCSHFRFDRFDYELKVKREEWEHEAQSDPSWTSSGFFSRTLILRSSTEYSISLNAYFGYFWCTSWTSIVSSMHLKSGEEGISVNSTGWMESWTLRLTFDFQMRCNTFKSRFESLWFSWNLDLVFPIRFPLSKVRKEEDKLCCEGVKPRASSAIALLTRPGLVCLFETSSLLLKIAEEKIDMWIACVHERPTECETKLSNERKKMVKGNECLESTFTSSKASHFNRYRLESLDRDR